MDFGKEMDKTHKRKKVFNYMMGKKIHFILEDTNPLKKKKHKETIYYFFKCRILTKDDVKIPAGRHTIQLPAKKVYYQMYHLLEEMGRLKDKNIPITIIKKDNYNYDITVHS